MRAAFRAGKFFFLGDSQGRFQIMAVGAHMARQAGKHKAQAVQKLCPGSKGAAYAGHSRALMQCQGCRNIENLVHVCPGCLRHAAPRIGGERFQVAP